MTTKMKKTVPQLRDRIRTMVKEEVIAALNEQVHPLLSRVRGKGFPAWVMRQYFDPQKHANEIWYDPSVTEKNVLEKVTQSSKKGIFPNSPKALMDLWKLKGQLASSLGTLEAEEAKLAAQDAKDAEPDKAQYQTGEVSLKDIGKELGGVTPTMINKLGASAMEKFRNIAGGKSIQDLDSDELETFLTKIQNARSEAADEFVAELISSKSVFDFMQGLAKRQILTPTDLKIVKKQELDGLKILMRKDPERVKLILLQDIQEDDNLFKSFQASVSKKVFPAGKRGRPRKNRD